MADSADTSDESRFKAGRVHDGTAGIRVPRPEDSFRGYLLAANPHVRSLNGLAPLDERRMHCFLRVMPPYEIRWLSKQMAHTDCLVQLKYAKQFCFGICRGLGFADIRSSLPIQTPIQCHIPPVHRIQTPIHCHSLPSIEYRPHTAPCPPSIGFRLLYHEATPVLTLGLCSRTIAPITLCPASQVSRSSRPEQ